MPNLVPEDQSSGVFELLTTLCVQESLKCSSNSSLKRQANKMRSHAYEVLLKKSTKDIPSSGQDAITALLTYYLVTQQNAKNVIEFKRNVELKKVISTIRCTDFGEYQENVYSVLKFLVALAGTIQHDTSTEIYKKPFTFGLLDEMLPRPPQQSFGSPQPYPFYPATVFQLPYSIRNEARFLDHQLFVPSQQFSIENFNTKSRLFERNIKPEQKTSTREYLGSLPSTSTNIAYHSEPSSIFNFSKLTGPRDLSIPKKFDPNVIITLPETTEGSVDKMYVAIPKETAGSPMDIWEIATQIDKNIPDDIWDIASELPPLKERQLIATSCREMRLWKQTYCNQMNDLNIISEKQFVRHIMYLLIGIETNCFPYNSEANCFQMKPDLVLEGITREVLTGYIINLLQVGSYYRRLYDFAFNQSLDDQFYSKGLVYEAGREVIRRYLLKFRMKVSEMYDEQLLSDGRLCMPTLLQILYKVEPFKYEIETIVSIYKLINTELEGTLPVGAELMSYLFNEISLVTNETTAHTMFTALFSICKVYFKFIEKFIFEGELNDQYQEFFIRKDTNYVNCRSKRYWDKGFHITKSVAVPEFLRSLAKLILLCGKSLRLLKLCNPSDPLILLISSDHPSVKCCASFYELERQQELLDVYRTRCLFVSGEPVTFDQILLKKEAARKAFTEMASLKQAETLEKIIAERKRLAQLIIAEKQHSLRVLEAAMAEAKAAKMNSKYREKRLQVLEQAAGKATEEVDSKLKEDERNKMMEYYSKLNMEVEKSKIHSEWKIKRLQLDQSRMQLLSTEERNLRRERIELQHKQNEECMAMSIQSIDTEDNKIDDLDTNDLDEANEIKAEENSLEIPQKQTPSEFDANKHKSKRSNEVFTAICNVAKSIFGGSKKQCDNEKEVDSQGNVLLTVSETELNLSLPPSDTDLEANDNENFINTRHDAFLNKQKGMGHEYTRTDHENNKVLDHLDEENNYKDRTSYLTDAEKNKLKVLGTGYNLAPIQTTKVEPRNDAQREAIINREKILGTEYYLPAVEKVTVEPKTDAHRVALLNKEKILGTEFYSASTEIVKQEPQNEAQREALLNKEKILGTEYNLPPFDQVNLGPKTDAHRVALQNKEKILGTEFYLAPTEIAKKEPQNDAQREAVLNKEKILGTEYNLPPVDRINLGPKTDAHRVALQNKEKILGTEFYSAPTEIAKIEPQNDAQREAVLNKEKILGTDFYLPANENIFSEPITEAQREAALNKNKILSTEFYLAPVEISEIEPKNDAQREALINKQKILGVEYNLPPKVPIIKEPKNYAQEEAIKNKEKILKGEFDPVDKSVVKRQPAKRSNLTLNLIPFSDTGSTGATPNIGALTPAEFYPRLDLETPTTAEVPFEGGTGDVFPHHSHVVQNDDDEISAGSNDKKINSEGFDFSIIVDEDTIDNELSDLYTPQNSPVKNLDVQTKNNLKIKYSFFDILEGTYSLDNFDPFGVKGLEKFSSDYFSNQMNNEMASSIYSHPAQIMSEVKKKPYENIFIRNSSHLGFTDDDDQKISSDNIATLTACLQRSVMLPLTYQLEVVNNSILTHFLVNLDMYEHMRSLKDYFFLMDGEFSRSICHNLFFKLGKTLNPEELLNFATLHNILDKALGSSISHIHKFSENLSFTISDTPLSFHHSSPDILQCLSLTYTVSWPLNIILSQEALARYAKVFQFLIKMRRISWVLSEGFESLKLTAKLTKQLSRKLIRSSQYISIQIYRHNMASLIRSLDNYIVTTCILSSWTEFETDLKKARTLDDLYDCHVVYIKKVLFRCLLNNRSTPVMKLLNDIFTVILKFTRVLKAGEWQQKRTNGEYTHSNHVQLVELYYLFEKLAKYLHKVITKLMECGYQRHLVELLTLINLNQYYEADRSKEETNTSIQSPV